MIDDGLFDRFPKPEIVLGQHVMVGPAGTIGPRHLAERVDGDAGVERRRVEFLMSQ
jgi:hypothetical protein